MNKKIKVILTIVLINIIILGLIFFVVDYNKVKKQELPVFCVYIDTYHDGGTIEYLGLGYKVIAFHKFDMEEDTGYHDKIHIGSWFMTYKSALNKKNNISATKNEELIREITILKDLEQTDKTGKYNYYVIQQYQEKPLVIQVEKKYNLEENTTYEFTFIGSTAERIGYSVSKIFDNFEINNIKELYKIER